MSRDGRRAIRRVASDLQAVVLVCRKCSKKLGGGFGEAGDERLAKVLQRSVKAGRPRKALEAETAVIEVGCLDLCPKHAVVALRADKPGDWILVREGAALPDVLAALGLPASGPAASPALPPDPGYP